MKLSDLLQRYAKQSPQPGEEQQHQAVPSSSIIHKGETPYQAFARTDLTTPTNDENDQQCSLLPEAPFRNETDLPVAVKAWSDVLQAAVWVVRDDLPRVEWPQDGPVYTHREVRILTKVGHDVLQWVNPVKEIFNGKVVAAHSASKRRPASCRYQQDVDV
jgi:hypothetical protein